MMTVCIIGVVPNGILLITLCNPRTGRSQKKSMKIERTPRITTDLMDTTGVEGGVGTVFNMQWIGMVMGARRNKGLRANKHHSD